MLATHPWARMCYVGREPYQAPLLPTGTLVILCLVCICWLAYRSTDFAVPSAAMICIGLCLVFECVTASLILGFRSSLGYLFVNDPEVVHLVSKLA